MGLAQELNESIMNAIQMTSEKAIMNSNATYTLQCEVTEVVDPGKNEYKVKVQDNIITAYGTPSVTYKPEDLVQVLFPNGNDWSDKDAIIVGSVTYSTELYVENGNSSYINISENLINYSDEIELCTYTSEEKEFPLNDEIFKEKFLDYLKDYQTQKFSLDIQTKIEPMEQRAAGDYGLILKLPILKDDGSGGDPVPGYYDIKVNVDNIEGDPYNLSSYTTQEIYVEIPADLVQDGDKKPKLVAFVDGFSQADGKENDIFMKNFSFQAQEALTEEQKSNYYMTLVSDTGRYFIDVNEVKVIRPVLKVNGRDKNLKDYECYWFRENTRITPGNSKYCSYGKSGQECLNDYNSLGENEEGTESIQQVTDNYEYSVPQSSIYTSMKFKCVLVDKDGKAIEPPGYIVLTNKTRSDIEFNLKTSTGYNSYVKDTGNIYLIASIKANNIVQHDLISTSWQRFDKNGNAIDTNFYNIIRNNDKKDNGQIEYEISFPCSIITELNTIKCSFQREYTDSKTKEVKKDLIGSSELLIDTLGAYDYKIVIENGNYLFKYDGDGDSPLVADYNGPVSSRIKTIPSLTYRVYKADGTELTEEEYKYCKSTQVAPANDIAYQTTTMLTFDDIYKEDKYDGYYHIKNRRTIKYGIANRFNDNAFVNDINLIIEYDRARLEETTDIRFLKEGESGTNGSKYTGLILQNGCTYGEVENGYIHKFQLLYNGSNGLWYYMNRLNPNEPIEQFHGTSFSIQVYCNGEPDNSEVRSVTQSMFNENMTNAKTVMTPDNVNPLIGNLAVKAGATQDGVQDTSNIIQAKVNVGPAGDNVKPQEVIYIYYPIEISYITYPIYNKAVPNIKGGFDKVLYGSDGTNPQYNNVNYFEYYDDIEDEAYKAYNSYEQSEKGNLKPGGYAVIPDTDPVQYDYTKRKYIAKTTMESNDNFHYVKVKMTNSMQIENINAEITRINNDIITNTNIKNSQNSIIQMIHDLYSNQYHHSEHSLKGLLKENKDFISTRANMIKALNNALADLYDFNEEYKKLSPEIVPIFNYEVIKAQVEARKTLLINLGKIDVSGLPQITELNKINFEGASRKVLSDLDALISAYNGDIDIFNKYCDIYTRNYYNNYWQLWDRFKIGLNDFCSDQPDKLLEITEYKNLLDTLNQLILNMSNISDDVLIYTYADIKDKIFKEFDRLIEQYTDEAALITFDNKVNEYNKIIADLNVELANCKAEKEFALANSSVVHLKPIVMSINTRSMSYLNDQDGNKLYTGGADGEYLFAPQVGAGTTDTDGFTGITIGVKQADHKADLKQIGLFGYDHGQQSIFLSAQDGHAEFGKSGKGQIIIDPRNDRAIIKSGNYSTTDKTGMLIDFTTPEIKFGSGLFEVDSNGNVHAASGDIAGWTIASTQLYKNNLYLDSGTNHYKIVNGVQEIDYTSYGIYTNGHDKIEKTGNGFYLSNDGLSIGSKFKATKEGIVYVGSGATTGGTTSETGNHQTINGDSSHSYIAYGGSTAYSEADPDSATSAKVYIGTDGITLGKRFSVDSGGTIKAYAGNFGDWIIQGHTIESQPEDEGSGSNKTTYKIILDANGSIKAQSQKGNTTKTKQSISRKGKATFTDGDIGNQTINENNITKNGTTLDSSTGTVTCAILEANGSGHIGGQTIGSETLSGGGTTLNKNGTITCATLEANGTGHIGGQDISGSGLSKNNINISSNGSISNGENQQIKSDGTAKFTNVTISGGSISFGGTTINAEGLAMTASSTKVGTSTLNSYIESISVGTVNATNINTAIANANLTTSGSISCGTISVTSTTGSTCTGRIAFTGNGDITIGGYKLDGSVTTITVGDNSYRVFLAKDI